MPARSRTPPRVLLGGGHLKVLDLDGNTAWERKDVRRVLAMRKDRVAGYSGAGIKVIDHNGADLWNFPLPTGMDLFTRTPALADPEMDGAPDDILINRATAIYSISSRGKFLWKFVTDDKVGGSVAAGDVNGDGYTDVVFGSRDGYLYLVGGAGEISPQS